MNRFTLSSLKNVLFGIFLTAVAIFLLILFVAPCFTTDNSADNGMDIPAVVYVSDADSVSDN